MKKYILMYEIITKFIIHYPYLSKCFVFCHVWHRQHANKEIDGRGRPIERKSDENTLCDICNQSFDSIRATIRHRFKMHPNSPTKFHCSYCGQQFPLKVSAL